MSQSSIRDTRAAPATQMQTVPRVALYTTHPIQYQVPWLRALYQSPALDLTVHFESIPDADEQGRGFGVPFTWDIPLLDGYEWTEQSTHHATTLQYVPSILSDLRREDPDVLIVAGWQTPFLRAVTIAANLLQIPVIGRGESSVLKPRPWPIRIAHRLYLRLFDRFLVLGAANAAFYKANGVASHRLHHAPAGVENSRFDRDFKALQPKRGALRAAYDIPAGATCFLFAGKLIKKKRPLDILAAMKRVSDRRERPAHALIVGNGSLMETMRETAGTHDLSTTFTGFLNQTEISKAYTAADVLVLPSNYDETWGLVVNEAMIFGLPAIVSDRVGCGPDLIEDGVTGYRVPFADIEALTGAMAQVADQPHQRNRMGRHARHRVLTQFTVEAAVEGTEEALRALSLTPS